MKKYSTSNKNAIIIKDTKLYNSPNYDRTEVSNLPEGIKITIQQKDDLFYEIELTDGKTGWINSEFLEIIRI